MVLEREKERECVYEREKHRECVCERVRERERDWGGGGRRKSLYFGIRI